MDLSKLIFIYIQREKNKNGRKEASPEREIVLQDIKRYNKASINKNVALAHKRARKKEQISKSNSRRKYRQGNSVYNKETAFQSHGQKQTADKCYIIW